jgi:hypothetical protein
VRVSVLVRWLLDRSRFVPRDVAPYLLMGGSFGLFVVSHIWYAYVQVMLCRLCMVSALVFGDTPSPRCQGSLAQG